MLWSKTGPYKLFSKNIADLAAGIELESEECKRFPNKWSPYWKEMTNVLLDNKCLVDTGGAEKCCINYRLITSVWSTKRFQKGELALKLSHLRLFII